MKKWFKRIYIGFFILTVLIVVAINVGMSAMRFTDLDAGAYFDDKGFEGIIDTIFVNGRDIKIVSDLPNKSDSILLVFVHGAPGSWDAFKEYITDEELYRSARVIAYDRPGYGGSGDRAMSSIHEQSEILKGIINKFGLKRNILIGHSYGGPIAGSVGLDMGLDAVIMIAPLIDPVSEPLHWYSYFSYWKLTSWVLPSELVVAGSEKFAHADELEEILQKWKGAKGKFIHVHGLEDGLAPGMENLAFSKRQIPQKNLEIISYENKGHLVIWTDYSLMKKIILKTIDEVKNL